MSEMSLHGEWLSLMDISGPFLAEPVLKDAFPQGLEEVDPAKRKLLRQAYEEWRDAVEFGEDDLHALHAAWIDLVLRQVLELDEDADGDILKSGDELPDDLTYQLAEHGISLRPDYAVVDDQSADKSLMLISVYAPGTDLNEPFKGDGWAASPAERMVELCRAKETRLGLVTNGEHWMLVDAPVGAVTTFASWYARLWSPEPKTLQSFINLLGVRRFFVGSDEQLPALLDASLKLQDEVTDALGEQVSRAVEVLIQSLDRADVDRNRELLKGIEPTALYEAGLTVMMRIVFLLSAEERGLLLLGDDRYEANYAVSTLRMQLRAESEEILERRSDAWARLLALFRAVYGGIDHEEMRLPALGGSLFDPNRFPFLEGRPKDSDWRIDNAVPLPIDNRTVLLLLDAVQLFQGRTLSYRALDVEQIGYVYEGLLERTVVRAKDVTLDLNATKNAKKPWVTLEELEAAKAKSDDAVAKLLKERTGSSESRVKNDLGKAVEAVDADKLLTACHAEVNLRDRIKPYFHFLRIDRWGYPLVYPVGTFMVTTGTDRRETGTHYTPKSLTEAIVKETLEPVAYVGPSEGKDREHWILKSPEELLELKICDPAMGSGAFLVQVCRWLSDRLVEAWRDAEEAGKAVTSEGEVVDKRNGREPLRDDPEERVLVARRLTAERCLYGVDANPLAVELAKLSIWLVTLSKGRPFGFLDHNLRSGDSLLGIRDVDQLNYLEMNPGKGSNKKLFAAEIDKTVSEAVALRAELRSRAIIDIGDVQAMADLDFLARRKLELPELIADALVAGVLASSGKAFDTTSLSVEAGRAIEGDTDAAGLMRRQALSGLSLELVEGKLPRKPFHWPLEFPEVFTQEGGGFDAFVGNPPFVGGQMLQSTFGSAYQSYLVEFATLEKKSSVDLVVYFFLRAYQLLGENGCLGLIGRRSISEGKNKEAGLEQVLKLGSKIYASKTNVKWPGKASVVVHLINISKKPWRGSVRLNNESVKNIAANLTDIDLSEVSRLKQNQGLMFQGSILNGEGFKVSETLADELISQGCNDVVFPFLGGSDVNANAEPKAATWVINFWNWSFDEASRYKPALRLLEEHVKPERTRKKANGEFKLRSPLPQKWWQHGEKRPALYEALGRGRYFRSALDAKEDDAKPLTRVIVASRGATTYPAFTFCDNKYLFSEKLYVLTLDNPCVLAVLLSDIHLVWAWAQKTSFGNNLSALSYTQAGIFETFPFPHYPISEFWDDDLGRMGVDFYELRRSLMLKKGQGLVKFYHDFHDPEKTDEHLIELRCLQSELNKKIVDLYGWTKLDAVCDFIEVAYLPEGKNVRWTVREKVRSEILKRLLFFNMELSEAGTSSSMADRKKKSVSSEFPQFDDLFAAQERG